MVFWRRFVDPRSGRCFLFHLFIGPLHSRISAAGLAIEEPMAPAVNEAVGQLGLTCDGMSLKEKANAVAQELGLAERA